MNQQWYFELILPHIVLFETRYHFCNKDEEIIMSMIQFRMQQEKNQFASIQNHSSKTISKQQLIVKILSCHTSIISQQALDLKQIQNSQLDELEVAEYIRLLSHQKKCLSARRWSRMIYYNQHQTIDQQNFKPFLMVISQAHFLKLDNPGYYKLLISLQSDYPPFYFSPIQKDIPRTLAKEHPFHEPLRNILFNYAIRNPPLVYCQGMNYLAAFLLINGFSEEEAFWFLVSLIQNILPTDFFKDLGTISISSLVFNDLIDSKYPQFSAQMKEVGMDSSMYLVSWFICLFTKGFINSVSHYLLSSIILNSRRYHIGYLLVYLGLGIVGAVLKRQRPFSFENGHSSWSNPGVYKDQFEVGVNGLSLNEMKQSLKVTTLDYQHFMVLYNFYKQKREVRFQQILQTNRNKQKFTLPGCDTSYPVCLHRIQIEKRLGDVEQVHILKTGQRVQDFYQENYFSDKNQVYKQKILDKDISNCLLNRRHHICISKSKNNIKDKFKQVSQKQKLIDVDINSVSVEFTLRYSGVEDRFQELSQYFTVDPQFQSKRQIQEQQINQKLKQTTKSKLATSIGLTIKKVLNSLHILKQK